MYYLLKYWWEQKLKFWTCKHPAFWLHVRKHHTKEIIDKDVTHITYHLYCQKCNTSLPITYATFEDV